MEPRRSSATLTNKIAAKIKHLASEGHMQHDIAARFGINQGRVSEIVRGQRFSDLSPDPNPSEDPQLLLPF